MSRTLCPRHYPPQLHTVMPHHISFGTLRYIHKMLGRIIQGLTARIIIRKGPRSVAFMLLVFTMHMYKRRHYGADTKLEESGTDVGTSKRVVGT